MFDILTQSTCYRPFLSDSDPASITFTTEGRHVGTGAEGEGILFLCQRHQMNPSPNTPPVPEMKAPLSCAMVVPLHSSARPRFRGMRGLGQTLLPENPLPGRRETGGCGAGGKSSDENLTIPGARDDLRDE